jgi:hypothetical protein
MSTPKNPKIYAKVVEKIKASVKRWPSAYASGMVVKEYKRIMVIRGEEPYENKQNKKVEQINPLIRWFQEKWIDIGTGKPCGSIRNKKELENGYYPTCRPSVRISKNTPMLASEISDNEKKKLIREKQIARKNNIIFPKRS